MRTGDLMQNDWVQLTGTPIYCRVCTITEDGFVLGKTVGGGAFRKKASDLSPIELTQDVLLSTPFWLFRKGVFKKSVRDIVTMTYIVQRRRLEVLNVGSGHCNVHEIAFLNELQQLYRHYTNQELEIDLLHSKRKEYSKKYRKKGNVLRPDE